MKRPFIRGDSRIVFLLGYPVAHSLSPQIHNFAFSKLELPHVYIPLPIRAEQLHRAISLLRAAGALGANVTLPHKQAAASFCDVLTPLSYRIGTVNTLYFRDNLLCGTTTDPEGFLRALASMGHDAHGGHIVLIGSGGIARTLAAALALARIPASLTLIGRNRERTITLAGEIGSAMQFPVAAYTLDNPIIREAMDRCTLLVNCTSAGLHPNAGETPLDKKYLHSGMTVFDTIYNPARTRLMAEAEKAGCRTQNGLRMLLYQGLASFSLWTDIDVREEIFDLDKLQQGISG
jgi:shikimate dehydrogenase